MRLSLLQIVDAQDVDVRNNRSTEPPVATSLRNLISSAMRPPREGVSINDFELAKREARPKRQQHVEQHLFVNQLSKWSTSGPIFSPAKDLRTPLPEVGLPSTQHRMPHFPVADNAS